MSSVEGVCDPAFAAVREVFAAALADGADLGAAVAVHVDGRPVVDLWGGLADGRTGRRWERDTACVTFSATKAVTAAACLRLAEAGAVRLAEPVARWWPEYAAHGKSQTTGTQLLTHQAGLPAFDGPVSVQQAADPAAAAALLAAQAPLWTPGTEHGYHATTFGWLAGELVRRVSGRTVREFAAREFGLRVGVAASEVDALARIAPGGPLRAPEPMPPEVARRVADAASDPSSPMNRSMGNPSGSFNDPALLTAGWPAAGLVATARELAGFYAGLLDGTVLPSPVVHDAIRPRVDGPDRTLLRRTVFGLGFMRASEVFALPAAARSTAFGHPGASGALGLGDPDCGVAFGYVPNLFRPMTGDPRAYRLLEAVYAAL